jgi:integrase
MWSDVITETRCPRLEDLHNEHGWVWYLVHKTKKKSQRAAKPVKLLVPLSRRLRESIELFRGIDPERVFPLPCNGKYWSDQVCGILERAGLDDASRKAARKPSIELSLGQKSVASFRKGCAAMWADHVSESAASYLLKHSVTEGGVSAITREHYLQAYRPLREIVPALETLPLW